MVSLFFTRYRWGILILGLLIMGMAAYWGMQGWVSTPSPSRGEELHIHADVGLFIDGNRFDFSREEYMSPPGNPFVEKVHFHDGDGNVIHVHSPGVTLGMFLESVGMELNDNCLKLYEDENFTREFCSQSTQPVYDSYGNLLPPPPSIPYQLTVWVNGEKITDSSNYIMQDLDRIAIIWGPALEYESDARLQSLIDSLTNNACIQSGLCPERGSPSDESACVTGGGCAVEHIAT